MKDIVLTLDGPDERAINRAIALQQLSRNSDGMEHQPCESNLVGELLADVCRDWNASQNAYRGAEYRHSKQVVSLFVGDMSLRERIGTLWDIFAAVIFPKSRHISVRATVYTEWPVEEKEV
jgi:hypothetical protein